MYSVLANLSTCKILLVTSVSILVALSWSFMVMSTGTKNLNHPTHTFSVDVRHSAFLFQLSYCKQVFFHGLFSAIFFCIFELFVGDIIVQIAIKHSAKVLSSVPQCKKAVMCLMEKIGVLHKLHPAKSYSAVGCEFNVNESTMYVK